MTEKESLREIAIQEPKKVFVNMILIPSMREISFLLINSPSNAIRPMRMLLSNLEDQDRNHEELKDVMATLERYETNPPRSRIELEHIYQKLSQHLHVYYLREFGIRAQNPNPKPIRTEQPQNQQPHHIGAKSEVIT